MNDVLAAARRFCVAGQVVDIQEYGSGNVHTTYLVSVEDAREPWFILQRINTHVFRRPELIMVNMRAFSDHVSRQLAQEPSSDRRRWVVPRVLSTDEGADCWRNEEGTFWRAISFVPSALGYATVQGPEHAYEAGYALGRFHHLLSDMDPALLHDTLVGFHVTPQYLAHYDQVLAHTEVDTGAAEVAYGLRFVEARRRCASVLEEARERGDLHVRPIHGDPKIDNILLDQDTKQAVSVIDLDTVKPGLVHYDIGDCLRSSCNPAGEETLDLDKVRFDLDLCRAILTGYLSQADRFLTTADYAYIYDAIRLIAFELGLRFFTDQLEGNVYFRVQHGRHNLDRALVQFRLTERIEAQEREIQTLINDLRPRGTGPLRR